MTMAKERSRNRSYDGLFVVVSACIFAAMFTQFYWTTLVSHFRMLSGNSGDAVLIAYIHEHVYQSILGHASLRNPQFYFPIQNVLGYTDAFLLNQIFYFPLRMLGIESLLAAQLTFMFLAILGGSTFATLLIRYLGVRPWLALLAAAIFAFGHALYIKTGHPQHYAIHFLPVVMCLFFGALLSISSAMRTASYALASGAIYGMCFATGYYMAWLFGLFVLFALPAFAIFYQNQIISFAREHRARLVLVVLVAGVGFCASASLVLWIYLPAIAALRSLSDQTFLASAATFRDILNVSDTNLMWGRVVAKLISLERLQHTELALAVTPLLVSVTIFGTLLLTRTRVHTPYERLVVSICLAVLVGYGLLYLVTITFQAKWSLFFLLRKIVPGAIAIRVGFRSQVVSALFMTLVCALLAEVYLRENATAISNQRSVDIHRPALIVIGVGILLALEQVDTKPLAELDRNRERAIIQNAEPPPQGCRAFAIYNDGSRWLAAIHIDAMRIGQRFSLPTFNGYSGGVPIGWHLSNVWEPNYLDNVRDWAQAHAVAGPICWYDATVNRWQFIDYDRH